MAAWYWPVHWESSPARLVRRSRRLHTAWLRQILPHNLLCVADSSCQQHLGDVVCVQTGDVLLVCRSQLLLRLDNLNVVGHARGKAVLRLRQRLLRKVEPGTRDLHLLGRSLQVKQRILDILFDSAAQVVDLRLSLLEEGLRLDYIRFNAAALKNRNCQSRCRRPGGCQEFGVKPRTP